MLLVPYLLKSRKYQNILSKNKIIFIVVFSIRHIIIKKIISISRKCNTNRYIEMVTKILILF